MSGCYTCGRPYDDSFADWTICRGCAWEQMQSWDDKPVYMDSLGIGWSQRELDEAGGIAEVIRMNKEARV